VRRTTIITIVTSFSLAVSTFKYKLPYAGIFGGVVAMTTDSFVKINGFSNRFWGWGGEDDDARRRVEHAHMSVARCI